jgi:biopolymer transport protein ExbB
MKQVAVNVVSASLFAGLPAVLARGQEAVPGPVLEESMTVQQIIETGGWPMYVLGAMSLVGVALVLYYLLILRQNHVMPRRFVGTLRDLLKKGDLPSAREACSKNGSAVAAISLSAIEYAESVDRPEAALLKEVIEGEGGHQAAMIQNQIQYLQDIAIIAPMIGLLGTVMGMLKAFNAVAYDIAKAKPMVLAGGVSQALLTTAAGLMVGIPAMMAYAYFRNRSARLLAGLESAAAELLTLLVHKPDR